MRRVVRKLLHLLGEKLKEIRMMERIGAARETLTGKESIPDRIVSVSKPYVRPIVRGKEVKSVEFGAKCNNIQMDGICRSTPSTRVRVCSTASRCTSASSEWT